MAFSFSVFSERHWQHGVNEIGKVSKRRQWDSNPRAIDRQFRNQWATAPTFRQWRFLLSRLENITSGSVLTSCVICHMSTVQYVNCSICQLFNMLTIQNVNCPICQLSKMSTVQYVNCSICQLFNTLTVQYVNCPKCQKSNMWLSNMSAV